MLYTNIAAQFREKNRRIIMGTYLYFALSKSVTQEEWERVYEESLYLAQKLNLADFTKINYKGVSPQCFCRVKEHQTSYDEKEDPHWCASADYSYMNEAEEFWLRRKLKNEKDDKNAGPAILLALPFYTDYKEKDPIYNQVEFHWGNKTQGYIYHAYLLGIACMMETRLKEKVYIYGDITLEQCKIAIEIINQYAKEPVELPARCNFERLYNIVKTLQISEENKLLLMEGTYLGDLNFECGELIRNNFDQNSITLFWNYIFKEYDNVMDLTKKLTNYLVLGFDFKEIHKYISLDDSDTCKKLLWAIIDLGNKQNPLINITKNQLIFEFSKLVGNKIDIDKLILEKEEWEKSFKKDSLITQLYKIQNNVKEEREKYLEVQDNYDITIPEHFIYYEKGKSILPELLNYLKDTKDFIIKILKEKDYNALLQKSYIQQINTLIKMNPWFPVRDIDWMHAIDYFEAHTDALSRYYPLFRMKINYYTPYKAIAQALFINDDFYDFFIGYTKDK